MAWMFRWLNGLVARLRSNGGAGSNNDWVEPSNAITRAILSGAIAELPQLAVGITEAEILPMPQRPAAAPPATRTAARVRRRRATRAA